MKIEGNDPRLVATAVQLQHAGGQQLLSPKISQHKNEHGSRADTVQSFAGDKVSIKVELPQHTVDALQKIGNISDFLNSVALNLRQTNESLTAANAITEKMKASLDKIIKNYPPFPIESKDRMEQLMSYTSLRKQILSLMVPAPPQPVYEKVKHLWEGLSNGVAGTIQTPDLPHDAPDSHVKAAVQQLDVIARQIGLVQESMSSTIRKS